jgi:diketogulonate reductase-like aldo/keto reductase
MNSKLEFSRRQFMEIAGALGIQMVLPRSSFAVNNQIHKLIVKTGEQIPVIGMGTSRTFDSHDDSEMFMQLYKVTQTFFDMGGGLIDSSPMYGSAQQVIGQLLAKVEDKRNLFAATKVWIDGQSDGVEQMEQSRQLWGINRFDLMQIHNLNDWKTHIKTLERMKDEGKIRYSGITTSHGRFHNQLKQILKAHNFDFLQLSYNIANRDVESSLLPLALDRGISVIVNRPYQRGDLFRHVKTKALPPWAHEIDCSSWGQYFLKFIVSHPAVTCAIPATTKVKHMIDNMQAGKGLLPTAKQRLKMSRYFESL